MDLYELPGCCGAAIIVDLYYERKWDSATKRMVEDEFATQEQLHHLVLKAKNSSYGFVMAVINDAQAVMEPMLIKEHFELLKQTNNPMHSSNLKTWFLDLNTLPGNPPEGALDLRKDIKIWPDDEVDWLDDDLGV